MAAQDAAHWRRPSEATEAAKMTRRQTRFAHSLLTPLSTAKSPSNVIAKDTDSFEMTLSAFEIHGFGLAEKVP